MGKINMRRVILGGLAAGVIIDVIEGLANGIFLADQNAAALQAINKPSTFTTGQLVGFNVLGLVIGILAVRLYAAIRPRYGAGPKTAIRAGIAMWAIGSLIPNLGLLVMGLFPAGLMVTAMAIGLIELVLATLLGAYIYKEEAQETVRSAAAGV
jgi:hypothetical protein